MSLKTSAMGTALKYTLRYVKQNPEENLTKILNLAESLFPERYKENLRVARTYLEPGGVYHPLIMRVFNEVDPVFLERLAYNFFINQLAIGVQKQIDTEKKYGFPGPFTILISPTMRCNLSCVGCYAGLYTREDDMPPELFDRIIREGEELGTYLYTILGGEPFVYPHLFEVAKNHPDVVFHTFTNGTLLTNPKMIEQLKEVGNIVPVISIEGWEKETDQRRGAGMFANIVKVMDTLKANGIPFGVSITYTRLNADTVTSDEFYDFLIDKGALFGWYFLFMPVGKDPDTSLMPTPEQRKKLYETVQRVRLEKPLFMMDFWGDAPYVGGCIAGGRRYIHINSKGDVEPCIFVHFSTDNIKEKSLKEALSSDFMKAIRAHQPFDDNLLLPCQIIDNPDKLREIVAKTHPKPTHEGAEVIVMDDNIKSFLDDYSKQVKEVFDEIWKERYLNNPTIKGYAERLYQEREEKLKKFEEEHKEDK